MDKIGVVITFCCVVGSSIASPALSLPSSSVDFGDVVAGSTVVTNLAVANAGDAPLHVSRVRACCGATASLSSATIPPGGEASLTLSVRPLAPNGAFKKNVFVHSDDPERPVFQLTLTGAAVAGAPVPEAPGPQPSVPVVSASRDLSALTLTTILLAGLVDGFNPCAFSIVIILAGILAVGGRRRRARFWGGCAFCIGSFLTYLAMGLGLMKAVSFMAQLRVLHDLVMGVLSLSLFVLSVLSVCDAFRYRREKVPAAITLQLPDRVKRAIRAVAEASWRGPAVVLGGLGCGFLVTLLDSLCTGQVYLPVVALVSGQDGALRQLALLVFYNLAFIAPLVAVFVLAAKGADAAQMSRWSKRNVFPSKIALGVIFAALGLLILPWRPSAPEPVSATPEPVAPTNAVPAPVVTRTNAVRVIHVGRKQSSPELRQLRLRDVELAPDLASDEILARRNELLDLALSRKDEMPELAETLVAILDDRHQSVEWREYCVQALPDCILALSPDAPQGERLYGKLLEALADIRTPLAGTALQGLRRLDESDPTRFAGTASIVRGAAIRICAGAKAHPATLAAALRLAGEKDYAEVKPDAERLSREGVNEFVRRCASKTLEELR